MSRTERGPCRGDEPGRIFVFRLSDLDELLENEDDVLEVIAYLFVWCRSFVVGARFVVAAVVAGAFYFDCWCRWSWGSNLCREQVAKTSC